MNGRIDWSDAMWISDKAFISLLPREVRRKQYEGSLSEPHREDLCNIHMLARKRFAFPAGKQMPGRALLRISADDYYKVYLNGIYVGQGPAQAPHDHYYFNEYEVSGLLRPGWNAIAAHVYYHGAISRSYSSGDYRQGLMAELVADGVCIAATDSTWKVRRAREYIGGEPIGYHTQFAENMDMRLAEKGWRLPEFDDRNWQEAAVKFDDDHHLFPQPTPPLERYKVKPVEMRDTGAGRLFVDFGAELTGELTLQAKGRPGDQIEIRCGEELNDDGTVRWSMRCNCDYKERWVLSGGADELEWFDYKSFRYAELLCGDAAVDSGTVAAIVRHYPYADGASRFESSVPLLDRIWKLCAASVKYSSQENFVDCPQREKGQYLGDNTVIAPAHFYLTGDLRMYRKALCDFALAAERVCSGFMAVAPGSLMQEIADFSLLWPMQLWQYYRFSGDRGFLRKMFPYAEGILAHFRRFRREDGLLESVTDKWNLVDWPVNMRDGYDFPLSQPPSEGCHNVINALYYGAMTTVGNMRQELGLNVDEDEAKSFKQSFIRAFYRSDRHLFADAEHSLHCSLHANVFGLLYGLVPDDSQEPVVQFLKSKRLSCSVYISYFYLKALAAAGEHEFVYDMIVSESPHVYILNGKGQTTEYTTRGYWANMLQEGATTCFEAWSKHLKANASLCHAWAASPISVIVEDLLGLVPEEPGWKAVQFRPGLQTKLERLEFSFTAPTGVLQVRLREGLAELELPEGVRRV